MKKLTNGLQRLRETLEPHKHANGNSARYSYRDEIAADTRISDGAYRLYCVLDIFAMNKGVCWPKHETLALRLNVTRREVVRRLRELIDAGKIKTERGQYELTYKLGWVTDINHIGTFPQADETGMSHLDPDETNTSHLTDRRCDILVQQMRPNGHIQPYNNCIEDYSAPMPPPVLKSEWKTCPYCKGSGQEVERFGHTVTCWACRGKKRIKVEP